MRIVLAVWEDFHTNSLVKAGIWRFYLEFLLICLGDIKAGFYFVFQGISAGSKSI